MSSLEAILKKERLGQFLGNFFEVGITEPDDLIHLTPEDFHTLGVNQAQDRTRLAGLIQKIKTGPKYAAAGS